MLSQRNRPIKVLEGRKAVKFPVQLLTAFDHAGVNTRPKTWSSGHPGRSHRAVETNA
jgi:hypothetical protein